MFSAPTFLSSFSSSSRKITFPYVTRYDVLKSFALITMLIDHLGYYFMPDDHWPRLIGRLSFPVWLFLVGYAKSRMIDKKLIGGALVLSALDLVLGISTFPLNILWTIFFVRLVLGSILRLIDQSEAMLFIILLAMFILNPFLGFAVEYGGLALLFALVGHYSRNGFGKHASSFYLFTVLVMIYYGMVQQFLMDFTLLETLFVLAGLAAVMVALFQYLPKDKPAAVHRLWIRKTYMVMGRYTLEIYVSHLMVFKLIAATLR